MRVRSLDEDARRRIRDRLREALLAEDDIVAAYLFGSFRTGRFRDLDVGVLLEGQPGSVEAVRRGLSLSRELTHHLGVPVDVRTLNDAPVSFAFDVLRTGERVVSRDEDRRAAFEARTFSLYHDFLPYRRRHRRVALGLGS